MAAVVVEAGPAVETVVRMMGIKYRSFERTLTRAEVEQEAWRIALDALCGYDPRRNPNVEGYLYRVVNRMLGKFLSRQLTLLRLPNGKLHLAREHQGRVSLEDAGRALSGDAEAEILERLAGEQRSAWRARVRAAAARACQSLGEPTAQIADMLFGLSGAPPVKPRTVAMRLGLEPSQVYTARARFLARARGDAEFQQLAREEE